MVTVENQVAILDSYNNNLAGGHRLVMEMRNLARARLVWFVGIAGYALLNAKPYWEALAGKEFSGLTLVCLSVPWVLSAILGMVTHFLIDKVVDKENKFFIMKRAAIDVQRQDVMQGKTNHDELQKIICDEQPDIKSAIKDVNIWSSRSRCLEILTIACLVVAFIWAIVGPLVLSKIIEL